MPFTTYSESLTSVTEQGSLSASSALIAAISSMRLLVVRRKPPDSSRRCSPYCRMAPYPPGPGLPVHAPSVNTTTRFAVELMRLEGLTVATRCQSVFARVHHGITTV